MSDDLGWPASIQVDVSNFQVHSPPVIMREFAGVYGERFGSITQTVITNGIREFANTSKQDAFRHAFESARLKQLEVAYTKITQCGDSF